MKYEATLEDVNMGTRDSFDRPLFVAIVHM